MVEANHVRKDGGDMLVGPDRAKLLEYHRQHVEESARGPLGEPPEDGMVHRQMAFAPCDVRAAVGEQARDDVDV